MKLKPILLAAALTAAFAGAAQAEVFHICSVRETKDDGVAQEVSTSRGVHVLSASRVPNPVFLKPFRTFLEVEQPESGFVLRMKPGGPGQEKPQIALFECDGGRWEVQAVESIAAWLTEQVPGVAVIR